MQVMRPGPDVHEHQRPEMHDREPVGVDRPVRRLGNVIVHHPEEGRGQEEAHGIVAIPPLDHRVLDARPGSVALGPDDRHWHRQIVDDVQHGHGDDEGQVEPVGNVDVRLFALKDGAEIGDQVGYPDDREPQIGVPFRFCVFLALRDPKQIARGRNHDEELVAQKNEPAEWGAAEQPRPAGALHDMKGSPDERGAAKGEDRCRRVKRPQTPESDVFAVEAELWPNQLGGDDDTDQKGGNTPEHRQDHRRADDILDIPGGR